MKQKRCAVVDTSICVACGVCMKNCPLEAITIKNGLFAQVDPGKCVGCAKCSKLCPASIITIEQQEVSHES